MGELRLGLTRSRARPGLGSLAAGLFLLAGSVLAGGSWVLSRPQAELPRARYWIGGHEISAEVASTDREITKGLMFRKELGAQAGMLFSFPESQEQCFWMKNTRIALSAAFIDEEMRVVKIVDMEPNSEQLHCSGELIRSVLEMNQGWFAKNRVVVGHRLVGEP